MVPGRVESQKLKVEKVVPELIAGSVTPSLFTVA
jgi:hypothetical protein